jgi:inner membrane protease ATP23
MASSEQQPAAPNPATDSTFLTWSNFFSILTNRAPADTRTAYFKERDLVNEARDCARCDEDVAFLFKASPIVTFLKHNIDLLGPADGRASISPANVRCRRCEAGVQSGGFSADHGIMLCANEFRSRGHLEDTLAHEMVHAYDHLRFKMDPEDLRHAACMEIRASTLSGECRFSREFFTRGQWGITQQLQECVRRRAALSVRARKACKSDVEAVRVVDEVWSSCFGDTRPFDEIYK